MLEVRCSGGKTYYQRYTDERGRERQYKIGPADVLSLDQARRKARQVCAEALLGADPQQKRREMRNVPQLSHFVHERYLPFVQTYKNSWQTDETVLRIHILPKLGNLALDEIKTDAISDLISRMRSDGYASGTMNRVIVILRYIYNLARKWKVPGGAENPAAGLSAGPDVQRNRFLSEEEAENLVRSIHIDENQTAARSIMLLLLTGAPPQRDHFCQVGLHRLEKQDAAGAEVEIGPRARHCLEPIGNRAADRDAAHRGQPVHFPVAGHRAAIGVVVFPVGPHSPACRPCRCPAARPAPFIRELPGQPRRIALCGAGSARPFACAHHAALRPSHA